MAILPISIGPSSSGSLQVEDNHIFPAADTAACIVARDAYFGSNPSELVNGVYCVLQPADTGIAALQQYLNSSWVDVTPVITGPPGQDGAGLTQRVVVGAASDLAGTLSSTVEYFIDGVVDMGSQSIEVPVGGLNLSGFNFDVSQLVSTEDNYTMFVSPGGGSGNLLGKDYGIEVSGTNSQVYNLTDATGFNAFEFARLNYNDCTSLGEITDYRQGLESGTGRFGGQPTLTLSGTWLGGYFIETSIVRGMDAGMTSPLFMAGTGFSMNSRFRSNQNIDLPPLAPFFDFSPSHFPNASTLQLDSCIVTRAGVIDSTDTNITPNIAKSDIASAWVNNVGIPNTFEGGRVVVSTATATTISTQDAWVTLAGTWTASELQHMDSPANGQIRHLGMQPTDFKASASLSIDSTANDDIEVRIRRWDDSASAFVTEESQTRPVNNLTGGRDVAFFLLLSNIVLDAQDYAFLEVRNRSSDGDLTAELDSYLLIERR